MEAPAPLARDDDAGVGARAHVTIVEDYLFEYRRPFFELLELALAAQSIRLSVAVGRVPDSFVQRGDDVPPLLAADADHLTVLPLATGEAIVQITLRNGLRIATAPLSRRRLTPSVGGVDAAAQALAITAAEIAAGTPPRPTTAHH